jgi:dephospho-CoA kinase
VTSVAIIRYNVIMRKKWIGLIGQNGSGKSTVCDYLKTEKNYQVVSLSDFIRYEADELGIPKDRQSLTDLSNKMKAEKGLDYFAKKAVDKMMDSTQSVVFDSVRHPKEMHYLLSFDIHFIGVTADIKLRYDRICSRKKATDHVSFQTFQQQDDREFSGKSSGQSIAECLSLCHNIIENNKNTCNLFSEIDDIINRL